MSKNRSFDEVWEDLKTAGEEERHFFESAEETARIINELAGERIQRGISQRQLAEMSGLKQSAIARMESLQSIPRLDTLLRVARALNLKLEIRSQTVVKTVVAIDARSLRNTNPAKTDALGYRLRTANSSGAGITYPIA